MVFFLNIRSIFLQVTLNLTQVLQTASEELSFTYLLKENSFFLILRGKTTKKSIKFHVGFELFSHLEIVSLAK